MNTAGYRHRVQSALAELGIEPGLIRDRGLTLQVEARRLVPVGLGSDGRDKFLAPSAARSWRALQKAAAEDDAELGLISAFRSLDFQVALIRGKLEKGRALKEVLAVNAPPGYSEHHTGCAVDIGTSDCPPLDETFKNTRAFAWLRQHAARFGFFLSYPRNNPQGFLYEPWHWRYR